MGPTNRGSTVVSRGAAQSREIVATEQHVQSMSELMNSAVAMAGLPKIPILQSCHCTITAKAVTEVT